ncbi:MAG: TIGR01459 family HAD-type hydrolase [Neomegalonema sp.]|nr:TIGR01459 family HAD-type hydrolase [Neomegalonema sp.]
MTDQIEPRILSNISEIQAGYDALLCDLWGCLHNGVSPYPAAIDALRSFRAQGGVVILLTNAPRPHGPVRRHLLNMGAPEDAFDAIVSSGDATRAEVASGRHGARIHAVGPSRDTSLWEGLPVEIVGQSEADAILCTGLNDDETETPDDYADLVADGVARNLPFVCANPDIVVDRGERRLYCAGAIAQRYEEAGGRVILCGKPHAPIYELALAELARLRGKPVQKERVLAVGDGIATDVLGAELAGLDCVFVTGGLAMAEVAADAAAPDPENPDPARLGAYLARHGRAPAFAIGRLR